MKFTNNLLNLLYVAAAAAVPLNKRSVVQLPSECASAIDRLYLKYSSSCNAVMAEGLNDYNVNLHVCNKYDPKKCQEFYNISYFDLPECKNAKANNLFRTEHAKKTYIESLLLRCTKDEQNRNCPLDYTVLTDKEILQTCESQICTEKSIKFYDNLNRLNKELENNIEKCNRYYGENDKTVYDIDPQRHININNYLKSSKCTNNRVVLKPTTTTVKPKPTTTTTVKPKPTTTTTTVKPKPTTTTTTVKPKPTTTTTTVKPKPTTTTTTVKPKPTTTTTTVKPITTTTTTTTTTTIEPKPISTTIVVDPEPTSVVVEPTSVVVEPSSIAAEPTSVITESTSVVVVEPTSVVVEPTSVAADPVPTGNAVDPVPTDNAVDPESSDADPEPSDDEKEPIKPKKSHKCFVKHH